MADCHTDPEKSKIGCRKTHQEKGQLHTLPTGAGAPRSSLREGTGHAWLDATQRKRQEQEENLTSLIITKPEPNTRGWWPHYSDSQPLRGPDGRSQRRCTLVYTEGEETRARRCRPKHQEERREGSVASKLTLANVMTAPPQKERRASVTRPGRHVQEDLCH